MTRFIVIILVTLIHFYLESHHQNKEAASKKLSPKESVDGLISKKQSERQQEGMDAVMQSAEGVQSEVADVMGGVDGMKETVSEKKGESGEKGDIKASSGQQGDDEAQKVRSTLASRRGLPTEEIMVKKIRTAINIQIKLEMKKAKQFEKNLSSGSAQDYNTSMAKVRRLQESLKTILHGTLDTIKKMYFKYFNAEGRRKNLEEV